MKHQQDYQFWVYILSNRSHILYLGMTKLPAVYREEFQYINSAIGPETELKHWTGGQKIALIEAANPTWEELMPNEELVATTNADSLRE